MLEVVRMGLERRESIAQIWADAFELDPMMKWLFPVDSARRASLVRWWHFTLDHQPSGAELHGTRADGCVAYWHPPRQPSHGPDQPGGGDVRQSKGREAFEALMADLVGDKAQSRMEALGSIHQNRPEEPHWYLAVLGTASDQQSKGLGGKVLAPMLDRCDRTGTLAYLESSNPANLGFYRRHRFETTGELVLGGQVLITLMARQPRPLEDQ